MEYKLSDFIEDGELENYKVLKKIKGDLKNPKGEEKIEEYPMFIYKKTLRGYNPDTNGGTITGQMCGKILKIYPLKHGDYVYIDENKYKVSEILPRIRADFKEFTLEKTDE